MHFKCIDFNSSMRVTVYAECIYAFSSKPGPCHWIPCWLLTNTPVMSAVMYIWCLWCQNTENIYCKYIFSLLLFIHIHMWMNNSQRRQKCNLFAVSCTSHDISDKHSNMHSNKKPVSDKSWIDVAELALKPLFHNGHMANWTAQSIKQHLNQLTYIWW